MFTLAITRTAAVALLNEKAFFGNLMQGLIALRFVQQCFFQGIALALYRCSRT